MSARELVMAILCKPLSGKELLLTEKENNVIIHRQMALEALKGAAAIAEYVKRLNRFPLKLMFVFGLGDIVLVNTPDDMAHVARRLLAM